MEAMPIDLIGIKVIRHRLISVSVIPFQPFPQAILAGRLVGLAMKLMSRYVLLLTQRSEDLQGLGFLLERLRCSVAIVNSPEQLLAQVDQHPPCLVILQSSDDKWSQPIVQQLKTIIDTANTMLVALTDCHSPSWLLQEENPGFDGFLVNPISREVLSSLLQSAAARQMCGNHNIDIPPSHRGEKSLRLASATD
jgi:CheY-like chemotaxis protein